MAATGHVSPCQDFLPATFSSAACPQWRPPRVAAPVALASALRAVIRAPSCSGPPTGLPSWPPLALTCA
eukprot:4858142-Pyramimonas_sp.AAC.1